MTILAVRDNLANKFGQPFFIASESEGMRLFKMTVNDPKNDLIYKNPEDFELYRLGYYDERSGKITYDPEKLADGRAVKKED